MPLCSANECSILLDYWTGLRRGRDLPRTTDVDPMRMRPALGHIMLVDVIDGGGIFGIGFTAAHLRLCPVST